MSPETIPTLKAPKQKVVQLLADIRRKQIEQEEKDGGQTLYTEIMLGVITDQPINMEEIELMDSFHEVILLELDDGLKNLLAVCQSADKEYEKSMNKGSRLSNQKEIDKFFNTIVPELQIKTETCKKFFNAVAKAIAIENYSEATVNQYSECGVRKNKQGNIYFVGWWYW